MGEREKERDRKRVGEREKTRRTVHVAGKKRSKKARENCHSLY